MGEKTLASISNELQNVTQTNYPTSYEKVKKKSVTTMSPRIVHVRLIHAARQEETTTKLLLQ